MAYAARSRSRSQFNLFVDCGMMGFYRVRRQYNTESVLQSTSDFLRCVFKLWDMIRRNSYNHTVGFVKLVGNSIQNYVRAADTKCCIKKNCVDWLWFIHWNTLYSVCHEVIGMLCQLHKVCHQFKSCRICPQCYLYLRYTAYRRDYHSDFILQDCKINIHLSRIF